MDKIAKLLLNRFESHQQMTINGQTVDTGQTTIVNNLICDNCNTILGEVPEGIPKISDIYNYVNNQIKPNLHYCPICGSKLVYSFEVIEGK